MIKFLKKFIDPDKVWFARDKYQHGASFYVLGFLNALAFGPIVASNVVAQGGMIYELGQTDTAYNKDIIDRRTGVSALGTPGFGISPLDLTWDYVGGALGIMTWAFLF